MSCVTASQKVPEVQGIRMEKRYLIVCASKYGSTLQTGRWIGERLEGEITICEAKEMYDPSKMDVVVLGSGIYSHAVLPEIKKYVE